ncbi:MAG: amidohydrolase family protein [Nitriliruptoraceae bacterium]
MADPLRLRPSWTIDGHGAVTAPDDEVFVHGDLLATGGSGDVPVHDEAAAVIDLDGCTLLPGMVDAHAHVYEYGQSPTDLRATTRALLETGFVTIRDLGSPGRALLDHRDELVTSPAGGPRLMVCGRILSRPSRGAERFGALYRVARGPAGMRRAVRAEAARDVDLIKVMVTGALNVPGEDIDPPQVTEEELRAIVSEAATLDLPVAAHAEGLEGIRLAVRCGVDTVEHGETACQDPAVLEAMRTAGIALVPTLALFEEVSEGGETAEVRERAQRLRELAFRTVAQAQEIGVELACGPDVLSTLGPRHSGPTELRLLAEAGLSAPALVRAATLQLSRAGQAQPATLSDGAPADLIAVRGDVRRDPAALWRAPPALVVRAGVPVRLPEDRRPPRAPR